MRIISSGACERRCFVIAIFDPLGREAMEPISGEWQNAGEHEVTIDAHNLMPGIYECRLNAGDAVMTAKMVVVR